MKTIALKFRPEILRNARLLQKISATDLAAQTGIHRSTIYMIERGEQRTPFVEHVATLAYALKIPFECLFYLENNCSITEKPIDELQ
jgi:transcriptional regulator with XRE-family HTH domain